jgi:hypothetical protein
MKKTIALLAVCGFAFAFVACGGKKAEEASAQPETEQTTPAEEEAPAEEAPVEEVAADSTAAQ